MAESQLKVGILSNKDGACDLSVRANAAAVQAVFDRVFTEAIARAQHDPQIRELAQVPANEPVPPERVAHILGDRILDSVRSSLVRWAILVVQRDHGLAVFDEPQVTFPGLEPGKAVIFRLQCFLVPELDESVLTGLTLERSVTSVADADVARALEQIARRVASVSHRATGTASQPGDRLLISLVGDAGDQDKTRTVRGRSTRSESRPESASLAGQMSRESAGAAPKDQSPLRPGGPERANPHRQRYVDLDPGVLPESLVKALVGTQQGEVVALPNREKPELHVRVEAVQAVQLPPVDDTLATRFGLSSLAQLEEVVRDNLRDDQANREDRRLLGLAADHVRARVAIRVAETLARSAFADLLRQTIIEFATNGRALPELDKETIERFFRADREGVAEYTQRLLVIAGLGRLLGVQVSGEDVHAASEARARRLGISEKETAPALSLSPEELTARLLHRRIVAALLAKAEARRRPG